MECRGRHFQAGLGQSIPVECSSHSLRTYVTPPVGVWSQPELYSIPSIPRYMTMIGGRDGDG